MVAQENFPTPKATQQAKEQFARRVLKYALLSLT